MHNTSAQIFIDSWRVYEKLVAHNYMYHAEFHALIKKYLEMKFGATPINILDLGCGDASGIKMISADVVIHSYTGYDLSGTALEHANAKLEHTGFDYTLLQKDIREAIGEVNKKYEVVYSSYALHHLSDIEKQIAITAIYNLLIKGGVFVYIDIFKPPTESREEYLHGYISWIYNEWDRLSSDEKALIRNHILNNDYPASEDWMQQAVLEMGYTIHNSPKNYNKHQLWLLEKE